MKKLLAVSSLKTKDYIVVLPMANEETDTAFYYFKTSLVNLCCNTIANLDFSKHNKFDQQWLDSLLHAKLIFICGDFHGNSIKVTVEGQVIVLRNPWDLKIVNGKLIKFKDVEMSIYTSGDELSFR